MVVNEGVGGARDMLLTRRVVMYARPPLLERFRGVRPGKVFGVESVKEVRGEEVKRMRSFGRGMKFFCGSSMTQLG